MDVGRLPPDHASVNGAGYNVVNLVSEEESDVEDELLGVPRVNGVDALVGSDEESDDEDDEDNGDWEIESIFEDTIEELGDEHLFDGGEHFQTPRHMSRSK
jgi:NAD-dependent histone deacetylase SIR2